MSDSWTRAQVGMIVMCAALAVGLACPPDQTDKPATKEPTGNEPQKVIVPDHKILIAADATAIEGWGTIDTIEVRAGEVIGFEKGEQGPEKAWILIPDEHFEQVGGDGTWSKTGAFFAFEVGDEGMLVRVLKGSTEEEVRTVHYSVMVMRDGKWAYVHGNNPPPRMIIHG